MAKKKNTENKFLIYRGRPLVRNGNTIYYGSMKDKFVIKIDLMEDKDIGGVKVSNTATVHLMDTNPELSVRKRIIKTSEKNGLYSAIDIANIWLQRALSS